MKVHPAAEIFPMMSKDELADLAADIKANGQRYPIITDDAGEVLIDGRNRLAACKLAGVKPEFAKLNGHDPVAFILSSNIARRHLSKGQQAMAVAMIHPEPEKGGRGKQGINLKFNLGFSAMSLSQARAVLASAPDLAKMVIDGAKPLVEAHQLMHQRLSENSSDEAKLERIRERAPDIADMVVEERLTLAAATTELAERERQDAEAREAGQRSARILQTEIPIHVYNVLAAIQLGEKNLIDRKKINQLREKLQDLLEAKP